MNGVLYCQKRKPLLNLEYITDAFGFSGEWKAYTVDKKEYCNEYVYNGRVVAKCDFEIEEIKYNFYDYTNWFYSTKSLEEDELYQKACMKEEEMEKYLRPKSLMFCQDNIGYAIHITNLQFLGVPHELNLDSYKYDCSDEGESPLIATLYEAPRNMKKVFLGEHEFIMITASPEELERIINDKQSVLIRKNVLPELLK